MFTADDSPQSARPCDIYRSGGTPCVAAHSTTRALFAGYDGPLYRVQRASDSMTSDIGLDARGGYADAAAQEKFCAGTTCRIIRIFDQSGHGNDLTVGPDGGHGTGDRGALADRLAVQADGHRVYGLWVTHRVGYRNVQSPQAANGVAQGQQSEGAYMVASGSHVDDRCCFDYGNAEQQPRDTGNGHMDALSIAVACKESSCGARRAPVVQADLENGRYTGDGPNPKDTGNATPFVTATLRNDGRRRFALQGGDAAGGRLTTWWDGSLPHAPQAKNGYTPMHVEGGIVLGVGGDNSNCGVGTFFEGAMVRGFPTDATEADVQANIASVHYSGATDRPSGGPPPGPIGC